MKKLVLLSFLGLNFAANAQTTTALTAKLVEKVAARAGAIVIPYEKYTLPNGLTVILAEDHSDPMVHVDITYHVGSAREEIGKSGFAHFFEHMMFQGSDNVKDEEHFKVITQAGGTLNGSTNRDRTNYYETIPANQLEKILWLEADRMGFLLDAVTQQKFEVQRATVKNERGQNYDNRAYGLASEYINKALYPYGHPYSWLTIGYIEDLNRGNVNDLKNFFLRWYGPNNATLTIGGDINKAQSLAMIQKYFGSIPSGPAVKNAVYPTPVLQSNRYVTYEDNYAQLPMLSIAFPGVPAYHKDEAALSMMAGIIGQGNNSLLYKNLVKPRKAAQASMYSSNSELSGEIMVQVIPFTGQTLADSKKLVDDSFKEFEVSGVSDEDLARFKGSAESQFINTLSSVSGKASLLALAQTLTGNPNQIQRRLEVIQSVTKEDIVRVYNQYVKGKSAVILSVLPKGKNVQPLSSDNYSASSAGYKSPDYGYDGLKYVKAKDNFDRKNMPGASANPSVKVPAFWKSTTPNGVKMIGTTNSEIPSVAISVSVKGGGFLGAKDPSKAGIADLVAELLNDNTDKHTAEQFSAELQKLGSSISASAGDDEIVFQVSSLKKNIDKTIALLQERIFHSNFTEDALERIKKQTIEYLKNSKSQPAPVAASVYSKILYGKDNVRTIATVGTEQTVANLTLADAKDFYNNYFSPSVTSVIVVGDITEAEAKSKLAFLNSWADKKVTITPPAPGKSVDKTRLYLVDIPKAAQSEVWAGYLTNLNYDALGEYYRLGIVNYPLGGAFNSRININLREDKGWTYGARSGFSSGKFGGTFTASASVKASATDSSVVEVVKELTNYAQKGISQEEVTFTKASISQSDARRYETNAQKAAFLSRILEYDLAPDFAEKQTQILNGISKSEIDALAKKYIDLNKMVILVVGDREKVLPGLQKLGYEVVILDADGNVKQ